MLRRKASPTETELRFEYSHMIDEALETVEETKNLHTIHLNGAQGQP
jgi:hypothetical protein